MSPEQVFALIMLVLFILAVLVYLKGGLEDKIDQLRLDIGTSSTHWGDKFTKVAKDQDEIKRQSRELENQIKSFNDRIDASNSVLDLKISALDERLNNLDKSTHEELMARLAMADQAVVSAKEELNERMAELQKNTQDDLTRALTKAETAFQLAHQANMSARKSEVVRVKFEPMKMRLKIPKSQAKVEGNV